MCFGTAPPPRLTSHTSAALYRDLLMFLTSAACCPRSTLATSQAKLKKAGYSTHMIGKW
jgi:hypothetical protein